MVSLSLAYLLLASSQMRTPVMLPAWLRWRCTADTTLEAWARSILSMLALSALLTLLPLPQAFPVPVALCIQPAASRTSPGEAHSPLAHSSGCFSMIWRCLRRCQRSDSSVSYSGVRSESGGSSVQNTSTYC